MYLNYNNFTNMSDAEIYQEPSEPFQTDASHLMNRLSVRTQKGLNEIYSRIFKGSMPELYADENVDWETYYRSYVNTYLQRDIRDLAQVADEMQFYNFMTVVAAHTSKPVVYEELANAAGISAPTAKKWLSILVSSHIIALVQLYHNNALKRVVKMPLLHFLDTGLAAYLLKWGNPEALERGAMSGVFFESYVFSEIYKSYLNAGKEPPIFYYRDKDQKEIDLLLYQNGILSPIEIKKAASPGKTAIKNFNVLEPVMREGAFEGLESLKVEPSFKLFFSAIAELIKTTWSSSFLICRPSTNWNAFRVKKLKYSEFVTDGSLLSSISAPKLIPDMKSKSFA